MDVLTQIQSYHTAAYDWRGRLEATAQEKAFHGEGNVWIHTLLVVERLLEEEDYLSLDKSAQKVLLLAAILHDIAKVFCTQERDGVIVSPYHAVKGEKEARRLLYQYRFMEEIFGEISFTEREQICALVRYHGLPLLFMEKESMQRAVFKASLEINLRYLYLLARADVKGRYSNANQSNLENIALFKEYCLEQHCFTKARPFQNESSKLFYFKRGDAYLAYAPHEDDKTIIYMMSGIPASGKDTYIKSYLDGLPVIALDHIREEMGVKPTENQGQVVQEAKTRAKRLLAKKESFIWNATNLTEKLRTPLIDLFLDYNAYIKIIYTEAPYEALFKRNALRERHVPEEVIAALADKLEIPKLWESQEVIYHVQH